MSFHKYQADQLFDGYLLHDNSNVLVTDEEGGVIDIIHATDAGDDVLQLDGILSPGFINCHCHLELSHMRGKISEGTGLVRFVLSVVQQRHLPEHEILEAIEKAEDEMLANGIVAVGDICNNTFTIAQKAKGRIYYHNFIEASGFNPMIVPQRFEQSVGHFREYAKHYSIPVESNSIVPHAPYSVADELWKLLVHFPGNHLFSIHNQESEGENEWFLDKKGAFEELYKEMNIDVSFFRSPGKTSLQSFLPKFLPNQSVILVHNVHSSREDILFARQQQRSLYWCLCPNANQYISGRFPDIPMMEDQGCDLVLGTDSLASNHQLSIASEIKTIRENFPSIQLASLLKWATSKGARALQMDSLLGSFEKGKRPGVVLLSNNLEKIQRII